MLALEVLKRQTATKSALELMYHVVISNVQLTSTFFLLRY